MLETQEVAPLMDATSTVQLDDMKSYFDGFIEDYQEKMKAKVEEAFTQMRDDKKTAKK